MFRGVRRSRVCVAVQSSVFFGVFFGGEGGGGGAGSCGLWSGAAVSGACATETERKMGTVTGAATNGSSMPQHAAASQNFHMADFFFITCQTCEPFVAQVSQNWMLAQWSMYQVAVWRVLAFIPGKGIFFACQFLSIVAQTSLFWCCFDMSSPEDTQTTEASQECRFWKMMVPLTNSLKHAAACRSMPQRAKIFLGTVGAWTGGPEGLRAWPEWVCQNDVGSACWRLCVTPTSVLWNEVC